MKAIYVLPFMLASVLGGTTLLQPAQVSLGPNAVAYSNLNLNIPAPVPSGALPAQDVLVQQSPVRALGRPVYTYTPQITEVRPELKITERTYNVPVPKPVYKTEKVTPVQTKYVAEPYIVKQPYTVPQPYSVPTPVNVPVPVAQPVHVQHNVVAQPALTAYAAATPFVQQGAAVQQVAAFNAVQSVASPHIISPISYNAAAVQTLAGVPAVQHIGATPFVAHAAVHKVEIEDDK